MREIGCLLLVSGWLIVVAALGLLSGLGQRFGFVGAGLMVELLGFLLMAGAYREIEKANP